MTISKYAIARLETGYVISDETPDDMGEPISILVAAFGFTDRADAFRHLNELLRLDEDRFEDSQRRMAEEAASEKATVLQGPGHRRSGALKVVEPAGGEAVVPEGGESA